MHSYRINCTSANYTSKYWNFVAKEMCLEVHESFMKASTTTEGSLIQLIKDGKKRLL